MNRSLQRRRCGSERGSAVVDLVLVLLLLVPVVLGIVQLGLVLHVRNTMASAAAEGARLAATSDSGTRDGASLARARISSVVSSRFARDIDVRRVSIDGVPVVEVVIRASVPALGIGGPAVDLEVVGHAVEEPR